MNTIASGDLEELKNLVSLGINIYEKDANGRNVAASIAFEQGQIHIANFIISNIATQNLQDSELNKPRHHVTMTRRLDTSKYLEETVKKDVVSTSDYGFSAKKSSNLSLSEQLEAMKLILGGKEDARIKKLLDFKDITGRTTLFHAVAQGKLEMVEYLVDKGADLEAKNNLGNTPFMTAYMKGYVQIAHFLERKGASKEAQNNNGTTLLHWSCKNSNLDIMRFLVGKGINIEPKDSKGITPLMYAAESGRLDIVDYLVKLGADIKALDLFSQGAFDHAFIKGNLDVAQYLNLAQYTLDTNHYNRSIDQYISDHMECVKHNDVNAFDNINENYQNNLIEYNNSTSQYISKSIEILRQPGSSINSAMVASNPWQALSDN
jgi:ankyrin repeat protein